MYDISVINIINTKISKGIIKLIGLISLGTYIHKCCNFGAIGVKASEVEVPGEVGVRKSDYHLPHTHVSALFPSSAPLSPALPPVIGGKLAFYWQVWGEIGADQWVLQTVKEGYMIPFKTAYHQGSERAEALTNVVVDMLQKGAIEPVQTCSSGFYSRLFLVLKASGSWRPVIDLSTLNQYIHCPSFKMDTPQSVINSLQKGMS